MTAEIYAGLSKKKQIKFIENNYSLSFWRLRNAIQKDIDKAGGWYIWRDESLLENLMIGKSRTLAMVRLRSNVYHSAKPQLQRPILL